MRLKAKQKCGIMKMDKIKSNDNSNNLLRLLATMGIPLRSFDDLVQGVPILYAKKGSIRL